MDGACNSARIFLDCAKSQAKSQAKYFAFSSLIPQQMCNFAPILSIIVIE